MNKSIMSIKFSHEANGEMFRDTKTKVTVHIPNLVVRHSFGQKIKGRTHLSSLLSDGIVQYRELIGTDTFFFNRTIFGLHVRKIVDETIYRRDTSMSLKWKQL